jgi:hypothetical protein
MWNKLTSARSVVKQHDTQFTIVVNPSNGPGEATWPTAPFIDAVKKLNRFSNVRTLGYIDTVGGSKSNATVRAQIATYVGWNNVTEGLTLSEVYFDHTLWEDDGDGVAKAYLGNVSAAVRQTDGWSGLGEGLVVHNPGRVPDAEMLSCRPDLVVMYEGTYDDMPSREKLHAQVAAAKRDRTDVAMLVHSTPEALTRGGLRRIIDNVRRDVKWLYVTDLDEDVYADYGSLLERWLSVAW